MPLKEIPSCRALRSIVSTDVLNFSAMAKAVAPLAAIAITLRSSFQVKRPGPASSHPTTFGFESELDQAADGLGAAGLVGFRSSLNSRKIASADVRLRRYSAGLKSYGGNRRFSEGILLSGNLKPHG
jgi:hypothetical protein